MHLVVLQRNHFKKNMQELWFLCITRRFNVLYNCMKIRLSYQVIEWTLFCDGQTDRPTDRHK